MRTVLLLGILVCAVLTEPITEILVVLEEECDTGYKEIHLDPLRPENHHSSVRFILARNTTVPPDAFCEVSFSITAPVDQRLWIRMDHFNLQEKDEANKSIQHYFQLEDATSSPRFAGSSNENQDQKPFLAASETVSGRYLRTGGFSSNHSFDLLISPVYIADPEDEQFECPAAISKYAQEDGYFKCRTQMCIPLGLQCDGYKDCAEGEDEMGCEEETEQSNDSTTPDPITSTQFPPTEKPGTDKSMFTPISIGIVCGVVAVVLMSIAVLLMVRRRRKYDFGVVPDRDFEEEKVDEDFATIDFKTDDLESRSDDPKNFQEQIAGRSDATLHREVEV